MIQRDSDSLGREFLGNIGCAACKIRERISFFMGALWRVWLCYASWNHEAADMLGHSEP